MSTTTPLNPEQLKINKTATYRINAYKKSENEREKNQKISGILQLRVY